jgi:predicted small lipoprotein YifL
MLNTEYKNLSRKTAMKSLTIIAALLITFSLCACSGPRGPQGEPGSNGVNGVNGSNSTVIVPSHN